MLVEPYWVRGRGWWLERSERERMLLGGLAAVALVALILTLIVNPLQTARAKALADIRTYETLSASLRAAGPNLAQPGVRRTGSASEIVTTSAASFGLTIQRIEPEEGRTRVVMEQVPYDNVVGWLADLERTSDLTIVEVRLDRGTIGGRVSAQVVVQA